MEKEIPPSYSVRPHMSGKYQDAQNAHRNRICQPMFDDIWKQLSTGRPAIREIYRFKDGEKDVPHWEISAMLPEIIEELKIKYDNEWFITCAMDSSSDNYNSRLSVKFSKRRGTAAIPEKKSKSCTIL